MSPLPPFEDYLGQALVDHRATGAVWSCLGCGSVSLGSSPPEHCPDCGGELRLDYRTERGRLVHWDEQARQRPVRAIQAAIRELAVIRLAVLYGSRARGDESILSDVDLLVAWDREEARELLGRIPRSGLGVRLEDLTGLQVDVAELETVEQNPILLGAILEDGQVLLDRCNHWSALQARREEIEAAAEKASAELREQARRSLDELMGGGT